MTEHILSMIGLAKKAGQVAIGEEPVGAAARAKDARVILVAQDAAPGSVRRAMSFGQAGVLAVLPAAGLLEGLRLFLRYTAAGKYVAYLPDRQGQRLRVPAVLMLLDAAPRRSCNPCPASPSERR